MIEKYFTPSDFKCFMKNGFIPTVCLYFWHQNYQDIIIYEKGLTPFTKIVFIFFVINLLGTILSYINKKYLKNNALEYISSFFSYPPLNIIPLSSAICGLLTAVSLIETIKGNFDIKCWIIVGGITAVIIIYNIVSDSTNT